MKLIDISRELLSSPVYPGDPAPEMTAISRIKWQDVCNTSELSLCLHNATHMDAPLHFLPGGQDISSIPLDICVGECTVVEWDGVLLGADAEDIVDKLHWFEQSADPIKGGFSHYTDKSCKRLLIKGDIQISPSAAFVFSDIGLKLLGVEPLSVADDHSPDVHRQLLGCGMVLLEGLDLSKAKPQNYFLFAPPIKISGADGAPVRAVLVER